MHRYHKTYIFLFPIYNCGETVKKVKLEQVSWQLVSMFGIAFISVTVAYILSTMSADQYYNIIQLLISFFAGYLTSQVTSARGEKQQ